MRTFILSHVIACAMVFSFLDSGLSVPQSLPQNEPSGVAQRALYFIPNLGQFHKEVACCAKAMGYTLWITERGITYDTSILKKPAMIAEADTGFGLIEYRRVVSRATFSGANASLQVIPLDMTEHQVNFFRGNERSAWKTGIRTSQSILYQGLYPRIDLKIFGTESINEYEFIIHPGGDILNIVFTYDGSRAANLDEDGALLMENDHYGFYHKVPLCYSVSEGTNRPATVLFRQIGDNSFGYAIADYDKRETLVIRQKIAVSVKEKDLGSCDMGYRIAVDSHGAVYVTGRTRSNDFPLQNSYRGNLSGEEDAFVSKLNAAGTALVYSTYIGGTSCDYGKGIHVDSEGRAYLTGITYSNDFPTQNALFEKNAGNSDAFIAKLDASGKNLIYSTFLGGSSDESGQSVTADQSGAVFVTGWTQSHDFPVQDALIGHLSGKRDAFVTKIDPFGSALLFSTYLGGDSLDFAKDITIGSSGTVWVTGYTGSSDFPVKNALISTFSGKLDAFVTRLSSTHPDLLFSTFLGGTSCDIGNAIAADPDGFAYITGYTDSADFPFKNGWDDSLSGKTDAFVVKINSSDNSIVYSTFLGGTSDDSGCDVAVDSKGAAYITGYTYSQDFPTQKSRKEGLTGNRDAFVTKIAPAGSSLSYSALLGGTSCDCGRGIAVDQSGSAYITGYTSSDDFPTMNAFREILAGKDDAFVTKFSESGAALIYSTYLGGLKGFALFKR